MMLHNLKFVEETWFCSFRSASTCDMLLPFVMQLVAEDLFMYLFACSYCFYFLFKFIFLSFLFIFFGVIFFFVSCHYFHLFLLDQKEYIYCRTVWWQQGRNVLIIKMKLEFLIEGLRRSSSDNKSDSKHRKTFFLS